MTTAENNAIFHIFTSRGLGGLELYVCSLIKEQARRGWSITVAAFPNSEVWQTLQTTDVTLLPLDTERYISPRTLFRKPRILRENSKCIVHVHRGKDVWLGVQSCLLTNHPLVYSVYMNVAPKRDVLHRLLYKRIEAYGSSSHYVNTEIISCFGVSTEKVFYLPYGRYLPSIDEVTELRTQGRRLLHLNEDEIFVLALCRIDKQKGLREFVKSLSALPADIAQRMKYGIVGNPTQYATTPEGLPLFEPEAAALQQWINDYLTEHRLGNRMILLPFQHEYLHILAAADIFVLPSYGEMYSLAVIEAMVCGVPVIGTNAGGTTEQIGENQRGILIAPRNAAEISAAVQLYIQHPELRKLHGSSARAWAIATHSIENSMQSISAMYSYAIQQRRYN